MKKRKCNERNITHSGTVRVFRETAANNLKIQNLKIVDLNRDHVKSLLTEASKKENGLIRHTILLHLKIIYH
jgi:hypothetical protein